MKTSFISVILAGLLLLCKCQPGFSQLPAQKWYKQYPAVLEANAAYTATAMIEDSEGYVICGYRQIQVGTNRATTNIFAFKIDKDGVVLWFNNYNLAKPVEGYEANEEAHSMVRNDKGSYYITGFQSLPSILNYFPPPDSLPCSQAIVLEIMADGTEGKTFIINDNNELVRGNSIQKTINNTYVVTGYGSSGGRDKVLLAEFTGKEAEPIAATSFFVREDSQNKAGGGYWATSLTEDPVRSKYMIAGNIINKKFDIFIMNADSDGSPGWQIIRGGEEDDNVSNAIYNNSNLYVAGYSEVPVAGTSYYDYQVYIIKVENNGNIVWDETYGGIGNYFTRNASRISDGNLVITGHMEGWDRKPHPFLLKVNAENGDSLWYKKLDLNAALSEAIITSDFGYLLAGKFINSGVPSKQVLLIKLKNDEEKISSIIPHLSIGLGLVSSSENIDIITASGLGANLYGVSVTINELLHPEVENLEIFLLHGGVSVKLVGRSTASGANFINTTFSDAADYTVSSGEAPYSTVYKPEELLRAFIGTDPGGDWTIKIIDHSGKKSLNANGTLNGWTLNLLADAGSGTGINSQPEAEDFAFYHCYPNPVSSEGRIDFRVPETGHVELSVYNLAGKLVQTIISSELNEGDHSIVWNVHKLPVGTYFLNLETGGMVRRQKVVIL